MPFYRIKIWIKERDEPFTGIRWVENTSIDNVQHMFEAKSRQKFHIQYIDVEVQMLSKNSKAVKEYLSRKNDYMKVVK
jgi:hypothetical protein